MRVACQPLNSDLGVHLNGSVDEVKYTLRMKDIEARVDWKQVEGNGASLTEDQIRRSGVLELVAALRKSVGVWYNITKNEKCFNIVPEEVVIPSNDSSPLTAFSDSCPACPTCDGCPACGVARCNGTLDRCTFNGTIPKTFCWNGVTCNDDLWLYNTAVHGTGRDMFWPPTAKRGATMEDVVGPHGLIKSTCATPGMTGTPATTDLWSGWLTAYYGGSNITHRRNIVWSNGGLDPWAGGGVYPVNGGIDGPMVQNISEDGSQVALLIELGAHHLDLFFSDPRDPPCVREVRAIEERMIRQWCQEWTQAPEEAPQEGRPTAPTALEEVVLYM